jgi:hypothetical protein
VPCRPQHTGRTAACECRQPNAMIALSLLHHAPMNWWSRVARTLSSRQCPRRLPKNQGYKTSPRSALSADGQANTDTRRADPPARSRRRRRGLAQQPVRHARGGTPRKSGSPAGIRRTRGRCPVASRPLSVVRKAVTFFAFLEYEKRENVGLFQRFFHHFMSTFTEFPTFSAFSNFF